MAIPSHRTTEQGTKELPVTVNVNVGDPAVVEVCDNEEMTGGGRLVGVVMVKYRGFDGADPDGLDTVIATVLGNAVSAAEIEAVS